MKTERVDTGDEVVDVAHATTPQFTPEEERVFRLGIEALNNAQIPYLVAGAFAKYSYTGIWRNTKDLDFFLKAEDVKPAFDALAAAGFKTEIVYEHWLAKAHMDPFFIDLIFGLGHGKLRITDDWFGEKHTFQLAGVQAPLISIEDLIASKLYVAERYRFDGADIVHLILRSRGKIDWERVLSRAPRHRELVLWYLVLFDFIYPGHSEYLPQSLMVRLFDEARQNWKTEHDPKSFRGTLLDPFSFLVDTEDWGYEDRRDLEPLVDKEGEVLEPEE
ncbi:MAG: hypothetical protein ACM3JD_00400 [Rudaea sp.]